MSLLRFLGIRSDAPRDPGAAETATVRRIAAQLQRMPAEQARHLASFAYVLARVAHADLHFAEEETEAMHRLVRDHAELSEGEAELAIEIAKSQARLLGGTENYVVTREFKNLSSRSQRVRLLDCLFAVAAADGRISPEENTEILLIAEELGFTRPEANAVRARYRAQLSELQSDEGAS